MFCQNCGREIADGSAFCSECGASTVAPTAMPVQTVPVMPTPMEAGFEQPKKKNGWIILIAVLSVLAVVGVLLFALHLKNKAEEKTYYENMATISYEMINGGAAAESIGNLTQAVWNNAIWKKHDSETDKYTMENGVFVDDFNDALDNLISDADYAQQRENLQLHQANVTSLMKTLTDPPKKYEEAYGVLKEYYDSYLEITKIVINPSGSLNSFSEDFGNADDALVNNYEEMQLYLK